MAATFSPFSDGEAGYNVEFPPVHHDGSVLHPDGLGVGDVRLRSSMMEPDETKPGPGS